MEVYRYTVGLGVQRQSLVDIKSCSSHESMNVNSRLNVHMRTKTVRYAISHATQGLAVVLGVGKKPLLSTGSCSSCRNLKNASGQCKMRSLLVYTIRRTAIRETLDHL